MAERKPWFLVMTPADANRPDSQWVRRGAASRGKITALPIAAEGWIALIAFIVMGVAAAIVIWSSFASGGLSMAAAVLLTIVVEAVVIAVFVMLARARMTRLPPQPPGQARG
jgi:hypothetical protein